MRAHDEVPPLRAFGAPVGMTGEKVWVGKDDDRYVMPSDVHVQELLTGRLLQPRQRARTARFVRGAAAMTFFHAIASALFIVVESAAGRWIIV